MTSYPVFLTDENTYTKGRSLNIYIIDFFRTGSLVHNLHMQKKDFDLIGSNNG